MGSRNNPNKKTRRLESEKRAANRRRKADSAAAALAAGVARDLPAVLAPNQKAKGMVSKRRARRDRILAKNFTNDLVKKGLIPREVVMEDVSETCTTVAKKMPNLKAVSKKRMRLERFRREAAEDLAGVTVVEDGMGTTLGARSA